MKLVNSKIIENTDNNPLLEGGKCCVFALLNWILISPQNAWLQLEKARKHFSKMKKK